LSINLNVKQTKDYLGATVIPVITIERCKRVMHCNVHAIQAFIAKAFASAAAYVQCNGIRA
jgi:hypothetical protein